MHITQPVIIQRQRVTLQKHAAGTKGHLFLLQRYISVITFTALECTIIKQDFVPPLVIYGIVYLTNMEGFLYFLNKAYGQLGYHSAN